MLEILVLVYLSQRIGKIAVKKGHKKGPNILFLVVMWFAGEITGALLGAFFSKGNLLIMYIMALIGAALGTVIAFNIVQNMEDLSDDDYITIDGD